jgi:hypothetical protein
MAQPNVLRCLALNRFRTHSSSSVKSSRQSTIKHQPANLVSQPLIIQDEFTDRLWELFTLPTALEPTGALCFVFEGRRTHGLDRVGRRTKFVRGDVRHHSRLTSSVGGVSSGSA